MSFGELITKCILQIREECQFFGALMLFADIQESKAIETAATDGKKIIINKEFFLGLESKEQNALLLHETLHLALLHVTRRGNREELAWNIAADIVVNELITRNTSFRLPRGAISDDSYADKSVEYIYEKIIKKKKKYKLSMLDIITSGEINNNENEIEEINEIESYWKDKFQILQASESESDLPGTLPLGLNKEIDTILDPEVDWRHALWQFVAKTPVDFDDLDRRFVYRGLYLEALLSESLEVNVCIDTSGSISHSLLQKFLAELKGILVSYPHVKCDLYWADHDLYGPYSIESIDKIPKAQGFGGTSFVPFFKKIEMEKGLINDNHKIAVYFTDGYGDFPKETALSTMWLVPTDCLESSGFPFGEVIRISND